MAGPVGVIVGVSRFAPGVAWRARAAALALVPVVMAGVAVPAARAQDFRFVPAVQTELRAEVGVAQRSVALLGVAWNMPAGYYLRVGTAAVFGREFAVSPAHVARVELAARFLADPFAEWRWGPYAGGGIAVDWRDGGAGRAAMMLVVGTELPSRAAWRPAVELGIGGGARVMFVLRRARTSGR